MNPEFDLLGDPVPENWGRRGRPAHIPTAENRSKVRLLLAFGWTDRRIAQALRITAATLRKHYFVELRQRDEARPALEANALVMVYRAAADGNVGAMKELHRLIERDGLARAPRQETRAEPKGPPPGKKELANRAAQTAHQGTSWGDLLN